MIRLKKFRSTCCSSKPIYLLHVKNIRKQYKNNTIKATGPTRNDEFELPDGSYSVLDVQDHIEFIIQK